ncbi:MAG TPA: hypothetical protein VEY51_04175 [Chondromyces sp.]|nr:hypothetical protein [Chondromyces sp.]
MGIAKEVPVDIPVVPVHSKVSTTREGIHFHMVECDYPNQRNGITTYNQLSASNYKYLL